MNTPNINLLRDEVLKLQHIPDESFERPDMVHFMRAIISEHDQLVTTLQRELAACKLALGKAGEDALLMRDGFLKQIAHLKECHQLDEAVLVQRTDEVRALEARLEAMTGQRNECERQFQAKVQEEIDLRAALAAAQLDKERLDWLEKRGMCFRDADNLHAMTGDKRWQGWVIGNETEWAYSDARAAVDAARKA